MAKTTVISLIKKKRGLEAISRIAKELESILNQYDDWESAKQPLREAIDRNLTNNEFLSIPRLPLL